MGAILNSRSAAPLATGGRLSPTAPFFDMAPNALVHTTPLSAAVTGKVYTNKDIYFVSRKEMKACVKIRYDLALKNKHNNL